jgi:hypothetical protein
MKMKPAKPYWLVICESGDSCKEPGRMGQTFENQDMPPYASKPEAGDVASDLDGANGFTATCGPHRVLKYLPVPVD